MKNGTTKPTRANARQNRAPKQRKTRDCDILSYQEAEYVALAIASTLDRARYVAELDSATKEERQTARHMIRTYERLLEQLPPAPTAPENRDSGTIRYDA